jgi:hypothetical protein
VGAVDFTLARLLVVLLGVGAVLFKSMDVVVDFLLLDFRGML